MSDTTYELFFEVKAGRYRKETVTAEVVNRATGAPCELESVEFEYPEDLFQMTVEFEPGSQEVRAEVDLVDEVYQGEAFADIVGTETIVTLRAVPRVPRADGGYGLGPPVEDTFTITCGPVPVVVTMVEPVEDQLPLPALGDEARNLVLRLTRGEGGEPWSGLELRWERLESGCSKPGELDGEASVTDEDGTIRLTYTAPKLHYKPGGEFFEEYRFLGTGKKELELFRLKIPLAPLIVYRMKAEKVQELEGESYGIEGPLTEVVEIDPRERVKILEGTLQLETSTRGKTEQFAVKDMECQLLLGDEDGVAEDQEGIELTTDAEGRVRWEIPELVSAFGERGTTYELNTERGELPELEVTEATRKAVEFYESRFEHQSFPRGVFQGDLEDQLLAYRLVHSRQLASRETAAYQKIRDTLEILSIGTRNVGFFRRCFSEQFSPLLGVLGDTFWDYFNYIWNLKDIAGKIISRLTSGVSAIARAIAGRCKGSMSYLRTLLARIHPLQWAINKAAGFMEWVVTKVDSLAGFAGGYVAKLRQTAIDLARDATELFRMMAEAQSKGRKVLAGLVAAIEGLVANVVRGIGHLLNGATGLLEKFAFWLMSNVVTGLRLFEQTFFKHLEGFTGVEAVHRGIEYFTKAIELSWHGRQAGGGMVVQVGNYLQSVLEAFFGKGEWVTGGASRAVSNFASLNLFDPAATVAVRSLHRACVDLGAADDPEARLRTTRNMVSNLADAQLTYEKSFIVGEAIKMFVDSMKIPVQVAVTVAVTLTTLGAGTFSITAFCTKMELIISTLAICLLDVPHAIAIFLGACLIQQSYLTAVANLEA